MHKNLITFTHVYSKMMTFNINYINNPKVLCSGSEYDFDRYS
jgi:hypothetical protein